MTHKQPNHVAPQADDTHQPNHASQRGFAVSRRLAVVTKIVPVRDVLRVYLRGVKGWRVSWCEIVDPALHDETFFEGDLWDAENRVLLERHNAQYGGTLR